MKKLQKKQAGLRRRHTRVRGKISGTAAPSAFVHYAF